MIDSQPVLYTDRFVVCQIENPVIQRSNLPLAQLIRDGFDLGTQLLR